MQHTLRLADSSQFALTTRCRGSLSFKVFKPPILLSARIGQGAIDLCAGPSKRLFEGKYEQAERVLRRSQHRAYGQRGNTRNVPAPVDSSGVGAHPSTTTYTRHPPPDHGL